MNRLRHTCTFVLSLSLVATLAGPDKARDWRMEADGDAIVAGASDAGARPSRAASTAAQASVQVKRVPDTFCGTNDASPTTAWCVEGVDSGPVIRFCQDGTQASFPLYRRTQQPDGSWTGWQRLSDGGENCDQTQAPIILSAADFQRLPLQPSPITIQPPHGWTLVNIETIVSTQATTQTLTTTVLGTPITVQATPTTYTWDFGDDTPPLVTTDPGHPWPHHTLTHQYPTPGHYPITLTTTWTGTYQTTPTGPWLTVDGHATTTTTTPPLDVLEARTHLVDSY